MISYEINFVNKHRKRNCIAFKIINIYLHIILLLFNPNQLIISLTF